MPKGSIMRSLLVAILSVSLAATPVAAAEAAGPSASLAADQVRAGADLHGAQQLEGDNTLLYIGIGVVALIILLLLLDDDDEEAPESP
jgi:hypothetical protein